MSYSEYKKKGIIQKKGREVYYNFSIYIDKIRHRDRIHCLPSVVDKLYLKWRTSKLTGEKSTILLKDAIKQYLSFTQSNKSEGELQKSKKSLGQLSSIFNKKINEITNNDIYKCFLNHNYTNPLTYNRRINVISTFLNWCNLQDYEVNTKIIKGLRKKVPESKPVFINKIQAKTMIDRCKLEHQKTFVLLALFTGMRHGEITNLKWEDVDFSNAIITLPGEKTKNRKNRYIPLIPQLKTYLMKIKKTCEYVVSYMGKKINKFTKSWEKIGKDICRIQDLRHNFATILITSGMPIRVVQAALGHSSSKMTEYYSTISKEIMSDTADKFSNKLGQHLGNELF